ncbi:carbohydrate kinase family protein [Salinactinospora qingdaonensis]|uniref:Carbohydrate kinase PfkB domain-containing protein n=1 Tax=Salinactinospora qingdaonensis TaxID=702744 RepID=A0ABP7GH18_9ACTN
MVGVIGNISRDRVTYPNQSRLLLGGSALYIAAAATTAGVPAAPISVIGSDLADLPHDPRFNGIDWSLLHIAPGLSCSFTLTYDSSGTLRQTTTYPGVAEALTEHALQNLNARGFHHVSCRRPLDAGQVLQQLVWTATPFSVDFHIASARRIIPATATFLPHADTIFVNADEFAILRAYVNLHTLPRLLVTDGPRHVVLLRHGRTAARELPPPTTDPAEVTGAGDTLAGTFLAHRLNSADDGTALEQAVNAATASLTTTYPLAQP